MIIILSSLLVLGVLMFGKDQEIKEDKKELLQKYGYASLTNVWSKYDSLFKSYAFKYDWRILKAIAIKESSLNTDPRVMKGEVSFDGLSWGMMQIAEGVGSKKEKEIKGYLGKEFLNDPNYSVKIANDLIEYIISQVGVSPRNIFLSYNQGVENTLRGKDYTTKWHDGKSYGDLVLNIYNNVKQIDRE